MNVTRSYLKKMIFGSDQGEAKHQPEGPPQADRGLMRGFNADMGQKDFFEMGSKQTATTNKDAQD